MINFTKIRINLFYSLEKELFSTHSSLPNLLIYFQAVLHHKIPSDHKNNAKKLIINTILKYSFITGVLSMQNRQRVIRG